ncbi:hypothetical protein LEP1GSC186_3637 [Leptospira noguchii serovar Autumnalis str. ZUN142]|uniref:Uncharacterized protein n=1 Tax=Leptospira noguchii serovar Autumnalis str. ZUN142 TaxID=1085540 RepID=M6UD91_9LEPT|nr:hypothetical protein LEP1GSC186_3637 [Leptospira noguchii serovar Autumnalis str. ZUN142]
MKIKFYLNLLILIFLEIPRSSSHPVVSRFDQLQEIFETNNDR